MLTEQQINDNYEAFKNLISDLSLSNLLHDNQIDTQQPFKEKELLKLLDNTDFKVAPYTTKYKGSYAGGLCEHCLNVFYKCLDLGMNKETAIKVGLLHDIGKVNYFEFTEFAKKIDGNWQSGYKVKDVSQRRPLGNFGFKSYLMARDFIDFTEEEIEALCNFVYISRPNDCVEILSMMEQNKLLTLLHCADLMETYC